MRKLTLPSNYRILPFRSVISKEMKPPLGIYHYWVLSWGITLLDYVPGISANEERYHGHFKVGSDIGCGGSPSKSGPHPAIIRFNRMLTRMGAKPDPNMSGEDHLHYWFDISTPSKTAYYAICELDGMISPGLNTNSLLNEGTHLVDKELIRNVEMIDWFIFAVLSSCNVPLRRNS